MKYAKKLNFSVPEFMYGLPRTTRIIAAEGSKARGRVLRHYVTRADREKILSIFPPHITVTDKSIFVSHIGPITPHVHKYDLCVINLYLQASDAETVFYDGEAVPLEDPELSNIDTYIAFDESLLTPTESFKAASGDIWVLNTGVPHAVVANGACEDRWVVQVYLTIPFNVALQQLGVS